MWHSVKNGYRFDGKALGLQNFVFFWSSKKSASLAGKGAEKAKKLILLELSMSTKVEIPVESNILISAEIVKDGHHNSSWSETEMSIDFSQPPP